MATCRHVNGTAEPEKTGCLLMALAICFIFLSACKPKAVLDTAPLKAEIAQEFAKADIGDVTARFNIGSCTSGEKASLRITGRRASGMKNADQGIGQAQYSVARLYLTGKGTSQNIDKAGEWMQKAAAQGMTEAKERFSILFDSHTGSPEPAKIQSWIEQSVQTGGKKAKILQEKIKSHS